MIRIGFRWLSWNAELALLRSNKVSSSTTPISPPPLKAAPFTALLRCNKVSEHIGDRISKKLTLALTHKVPEPLGDRISRLTKGAKRLAALLSYPSMLRSSASLERTSILRLVLTELMRVGDISTMRYSFYEG